MPRDRRHRASGSIVLVSALLVAALVAFHRALPEADGWLSIIETTFPWLGIAVLALVVAALVGRSRRAGVGVVLLCVVWGVIVAPIAIPVSPPVSGRFTIVSENVKAQNPQARSIAADLAASEPDAIALQELSDDVRVEVADELAAAYPFDYVVGTVGIWSRTELSDVARVDLGLGWNRALRVDVDTPGGRTRLYVVHLASFRPGEHEDRDAMLSALATTVAEDPSDRLAIVGDVNTATDDHELVPLLAEANMVRGESLGFPLTWPSAFPLVALDHAFTRGIPAATMSVLPANGSDHRGISLTIGSA